MGSIKKFNFGGLDYKSNDLVRDPMKASDARNVTKTITGDLDKRGGYAVAETAAFELEESCYYKKLDQDVFINTDGTIWKTYNGSRQSCSIASLAQGSSSWGTTTKYTVGQFVMQTSVTYRCLIAHTSGIFATDLAASKWIADTPINRIIYTDYSNNLYLTTSDGKSPVVKYDGGDAYLAGLPAPMVIFANTDATISSPGSTYFYRFFYQFKDLGGNITKGPYNQLGSTSTTATITVSTFNSGNPYGAFYNKYMTVGYAVLASPTQYAVTSVNNFLYAYSTNYVVGDILMIDMDECPYINTLVGAKRRFINLTITTIATISANVIKVTFDATQLSGISFNVQTAKASKPLDCRLKLRSFQSPTQSFGYLECSPVTFTIASDIPGNNSLVFQVGQQIDNSQNDQASISIASSPYSYYSLSKFENVYNEAGQKLRPPLCKYLAVFGSQLVFGNIVGVWDQINNFSQYDTDNVLIYSDTGIADNGETNSANTQVIGETYDGPITGLKRCNDLLVVTKSNSIFALHGILFPGSYSLRKIPTNYIGCLSHNSIIQVEGGLFFNGNDGIYFTDGVYCNKMTSNIDPFFVGLGLFSTPIDSSKSRSIIDSKNRRYLFYMTDGAIFYCLAYSYEFKEWFIWDTLDMSKGLYQKNNKDVVFAKGTSTYKLNSLYSDNGSAISAYYKTNWEDLRQPGLDKKFKFNRIWNLNSVQSQFNLGIQKNWTDTTLTTVACVVPANGTIQKFYDQKNVHAIRFVFSNNVLSQGMLLTGYEVEYEATQILDKGN